MITPSLTYTTKGVVSDAVPCTCYSGRQGFVLVQYIAVRYCGWSFGLQRIPLLQCFLEVQDQRYVIVQNMNQPMWGASLCFVPSVHTRSGLRMTCIVNSLLYFCDCPRVASQMKHVAVCCIDWRRDVLAWGMAGSVSCKQQLPPSTPEWAYGSVDDWRAVWAEGGCLLFSFLLLVDSNFQCYGHILYYFAKVLLFLWVVPAYLWWDHWMRAHTGSIVCMCCSLYWFFAFVFFFPHCILKIYIFRVHGKLFAS